MIYDDQHTDDVHLIFSLFSTSVFSLVSPFFWAGQLAGMQAPSSLFFSSTSPLHSHLVSTTIDMKKFTNVAKVLCYNIC